MSWGVGVHKAFDTDIDADLRPFARAVQAAGVPIRVSEEAGRQVIWARSEEEAAWVARLWPHYVAGELPVSADIPIPAPVRRGQGGVALSQLWRTAPVTAALLLACIVIFLKIWVLQDVAWLAALSFQPLVVAGGQVVGIQDAHLGWQAGEYWRLFTPALLHFGVLHIVFNMLWLWEFGRRIETRRGSVHFAGLVLVTAVVSNASQYFAQQWAGQPGLFGGMSGVLFAFVGYLGVWNTLKPAARYDVPRGLLLVMVGYLLVCMTGVFSLAGFGQIANAAHVGGLLSGAVAGLFSAFWIRERHGY